MNLDFKETATLFHTALLIFNSSRENYNPPNSHTNRQKKETPENRLISRGKSGKSPHCLVKTRQSRPIFAVPFISLAKFAQFVNSAR